MPEDATRSRSLSLACRLALLALTGWCLSGLGSGETHRSAAGELSDVRGFVERFAYLHPSWAAPQAASRPLPELIRTALGPPGPAWLQSDQGAASRLELRQVAGGPAVRYVVVTRRPGYTPRPDDPATVGREWLWPSAELPPTDLVYDCTEERLHGKAKPILCDLRTVPVRVFALLPTQVEQLLLQGYQRVARGGTAVLEVRCGDAGERPVTARLPLHVALLRPDGETQQAQYLATSEQGLARVAWELPADVELGEWQWSVRCQLQGLVGTLPVAVSTTPSTAARELTHVNAAQSWQSRPLRWTFVPPGE